MHFTFNRKLIPRVWEAGCFWLRRQQHKGVNSLELLEKFLSIYRITESRLIKKSQATTDKSSEINEKWDWWQAFINYQFNKHKERWIQSGMLLYNPPWRICCHEIVSLILIWFPSSKKQRITCKVARISLASQIPYSHSLTRTKLINLNAVVNP